MTPQRAATRDLCWRGEKELGDLAERLRAPLDAWGDAWAVPVTAVACRNAWEERPAGSTEPRHWHAIATHSDGMPLVHLGMQAVSLADTLATVMFGAAPEAAVSRGSVHSPTLARSLAASAADALAKALARCLDLRPVEFDDETDAAPPPASKAWSGAVAVTVSLGAPAAVLKLELRVGGAALPRQNNPGRTETRSRTGPLQPLLDVIAHRPIPVRASLAATPITLRHLLELAPGDVIVTSHPLDAPLHVAAASPVQQPSIPLYAGRLAQSDGQMAVTLMPAAELISRSSR